jgi:hypothetical protein
MDAVVPGQVLWKRKKGKDWSYVQLLVANLEGKE